MQFSYGLDADRDGSLAAEEIASTQILCDGQNGETGAAGAAGSNGHSMVFQSIAASSEQCPAGGVTTLMALDILDTAAYSSDLPNQVAMTICNGVDALDQLVEPSAEQLADSVLIVCGNSVRAKSEKHANRKNLIN